jgi:hypothetical protein
MAAGQFRWRSNSSARLSESSASAESVEDGDESGADNSGPLVGVAGVAGRDVDDDVELEIGGDAQLPNGTNQAIRAARSHAVRAVKRGRIAIDPPTAERNGRDRGSRARLITDPGVLRRMRDDAANARPAA